MPDPLDDLLRRAVRQAARRFPPPDLPRDLDEAIASGPAACLAFCLEAARRASAEAGASPADDLARPFTEALAAILRQAARAEEGDAAWQARVLAAGSPALRAWLDRGATRSQEDRALRTLVDAIAHPGKLAGMASGAVRDGLARLHAMAASGDREGLARAAASLARSPQLHDDALRARLHALIAQPALSAPSALPATPVDDDPVADPASPVVDRYLVLRERAARADPGGQGGSLAERSLLGADRGAATEAATRRAFHAIARLLDAEEGQAARPRHVVHRVVHQLRVPAGFPGEAGRAKSEWDVALLRERPGTEGLALVLLAEAKASPETAVQDLPRLLRGLRRLSQAPEGAPIRFPCAEGVVPLQPASLRDLHPHGEAIPARVVYCCDAASEAPPPPLSASARGLLLAEPACLRFAWGEMQGECPPVEDLRSVWDDVRRAPRLRAVLHQHAQARCVRRALLHPDDLVAAVAWALGQGRAR